MSRRYRIFYMIVLATLIVLDVKTRPARSHDLPFTLPPGMHEAMHVSIVRGLARQWLKVQTPEVVERGFLLGYKLVDPNENALTSHAILLPMERLESERGSHFDLVWQNEFPPAKKIKEVWFAGRWVDREIKKAVRFDMKDFAELHKELTR